MPPQPRVPAELRGCVFRGSSAVAAGLLSSRQLSGQSWRRLFPDVYVHRDLPDSHALRARAAAGVLLPGAVVTGPSAAVLWSVELAGVDDDVELTLPPGSHPVRVAGLRVRRSRLPAGSLQRRRGVRVTSPEVTAVRLAGSLPPDDAVVAVDRMVREGAADLQMVRDLAAAATGPGSARARAACALADGRAESPPETRLRLLIGRSGFPAPVAQFAVYDRGRFVARVDFAWPGSKVAVEYDGLWHADSAQFARDRQRLNRLHAAGWRVVFVTAADLRRPAEVLARMTALLAAR